MPIPLEQIRRWRQMVASNKLEQVIREMLDGARYPDAVTRDIISQLSSRYHDLKRQERLGLKSSAEINVERNQIVYALLQTLGDLEREAEAVSRGGGSRGVDLPDEAGAEPPAAEPMAPPSPEPEPATPPAPAAPAREGALLYRIPGQMQLEQETACTVRLAFDEATARRGLEGVSGVTVRSVRVAEVMSVELIDPNPEPTFAIRRPAHDEAQPVLAGDFTEWLFLVRPLRAGAFPLMLKVSVVLIVQGVERRKNVVFEELITISTAAAPVSGGEAPFKTTDPLPDAGQPGLSLFLSWSGSGRDEPLRQDLVNQMAPLVLNGMVHHWDRSQVPPGADTAAAIQARLAGAEIFALLLSADYLASRDCHRELEAIRRQAAARRAVIVPILARPCHWQMLSIGQLQVLPRSGRAVAQYGNDTDSAWAEVVGELHQTVEVLSAELTR